MTKKLTQLTFAVLLLLACSITPIVTTSTNTDPYREPWKRPTLASAVHVWQAESDHKEGWTR